MTARQPRTTVDLMTRKARADDVADLCLALPEVVFGTSWGDRPTYLVRGRGFVLYRAPHRSAVDPLTGELYDDLLVITTPSTEEKQALVDDPTLPFFTIDHFDGHRAVLVQESRLGEIDRDELAEILTDAWASVAPRALVRKYLADG